MGERRDRNNRRWAQAMSLIPIVGGQISQGIMQNSLSRNQREAAAAINPVDVEYKASEFAKEQLSSARNAINARMPGSQQMENNLYKSGANTMMNLARAANPQQLIASAGAVQSNTNNALSNLATQEAQYRTSMLGNLNNALQVMTNEGDKVYADQTNRFNRQYAEKQNLLNASQQNFSNSLQSATGAMNAGISTALQIFGLPSFAGKKINPTGPAETIGSFNPMAGWFTAPSQANYTPRITPFQP